MESDAIGILIPLQVNFLLWLFVYLFFFLVGLGVELRASDLQSSYSTA
jgi:hypothetical protein